MAQSTQQQLATYDQQYRDLAAELAQIGYIRSGSLAQRHNRCGTKTCRCHADPPQLHGPYWQWTAKVSGKTVNRRLSPEQAQMYSEWIANDRRMREVIAQMRQVAAKATELRLNQAAEV